MSYYGIEQKKKVTKNPETLASTLKEEPKPLRVEEIVRAEQVRCKVAHAQFTSKNKISALLLLPSGKTLIISEGCSESNGFANKIEWLTDPQAEGYADVKITQIKTNVIPGDSSRLGELRYDFKAEVQKLYLSKKCF